MTGLRKTMGYLVSILNCLCCLILFLTIRKAHRIASMETQFFLARKKKKKLKAAITASHVVIILSCTIVNFLNYNVLDSSASVVSYRLFSTYFVLIAV